LSESANIGKAINDAMRAIEAQNEDLKEILPKTYNRLDNYVLFNLLKNFNSVPMDIEGDAFGKIYEYFLGNFATAEGTRGGEFFTPTALVRLIVEIIQPYHGRIYDPACGSGGMFVQSEKFVTEHQGRVNDISIFGQESNQTTWRLAKMNLASFGIGLLLPF
jgi:type I restriction enzyme M protein